MLRPFYLQIDYLYQTEKLKCLNALGEATNHFVIKKNKYDDGGQQLVISVGQYAMS